MSGPPSGSSSARAWNPAAAAALLGGGGRSSGDASRRARGHKQKPLRTPFAGLVQLFSNSTTLLSTAKIGFFVLVFFAVTNVVVVLVVSSARLLNNDKDRRLIGAAPHQPGQAPCSGADSADCDKGLVQQLRHHQPLPPGPNETDNDDDDRRRRESEHKPQPAGAVDGPRSPTTTTTTTASASASDPQLHASGSRWRRFLTPNFRWDSRRVYKIHEFVHAGSDFQRWSSASAHRQYDDGTTMTGTGTGMGLGSDDGNVSRPLLVTLATHSSPDRLHWASMQALAWDGPMSVAVFAPGPDYAHLTLLLEFLFRCFPDLERRSAIHVVYPAASPPLVPGNQAELRALVDRLGAPACESAPATAFAKRLKAVTASARVGRQQGRPAHYRLSSSSFYSSSLSSSSSLPYPQNHLRNVARKTSPTDYVLLLDIDVVPSPDAATTLTRFFLDAQDGRDQHNRHIKSPEQGQQSWQRRRRQRREAEHGGAAKEEEEEKLAAHDPASASSSSSASASPRFPPDLSVERSVFVLPTYELSETLKSVPKTKEDLIRLERNGLAQPYHIQVFQPNQFATNFTLWEQTNYAADPGPGPGPGLARAWPGSRTRSRTRSFSTSPSTSRGTPCRRTTSATSDTDSRETLRCWRRSWPGSGSSCSRPCSRATGACTRTGAAPGAQPGESAKTTTTTSCSSRPRGSCPSGTAGSSWPEPDTRPSRDEIETS